MKGQEGSITNLRPLWLPSSEDADLVPATGCGTNSNLALQGKNISKENWAI